MVKFIRNLRKIHTTVLDKRFNLLQLKEHPDWDNTWDTGDFKILAPTILQWILSTGTPCSSMMTFVSFVPDTKLEVGAPEVARDELHDPIPPGNPFLDDSVFVDQFSASVPAPTGTVSDTPIPTMHSTVSTMHTASPPFSTMLSLVPFSCSSYSP